MLRLTGCSLVCSYATGSAEGCQCQCKGSMHGALADKPAEPQVIKCSPAAEKRCKEGNEDGACQCACGGINHGIYQHIADFESTVRITGMFAHTH